MSAQLPTSDVPTTKIFEHTFDDDGVCTLVKNKISDREAKELSYYVPTILNERRLLTKAELEAEGWMELEAGQLVWFETAGEPGKRAACIKLSDAMLHEMGLLERIGKLRAHLLAQKSTFQDIQIAADKTEFAKKGSVHEILISRQPTNGVNSVQMAALPRSGEKWNSSETISELLDIATEAMKRSIPGMSDPARELRWLQKGSLTTGPKSNHLFTSCQLNYSPMDTESLKRLGAKFGSAHTDERDDSAALSGLISLNNFDEDHFDGRFSIPPLRITTTLKPGEVLIFPARFRHLGSAVGPYSVPRGSPLRNPRSLLYELVPLPEGTPCMRLNAVPYMNHELTELEFRKLNKEVWTKAMRKVFATPQLHHEWMMRQWIVNEKQIRDLIEKANISMRFDNSDPVTIFEIDVDEDTISLPDFDDGVGPKVLERVGYALWEDDTVWRQTKNMANKVVEDLVEEVIAWALEKDIEQPSTDAKFDASKWADRSATHRTIKAHITKERKAEMKRLKEDAAMPVARYPAEDYSRLFKIVDEEVDDNQEVFTTPEHAQEILDSVGQPNPSIEKYKQDMEGLFCGGNAAIKRRLSEDGTPVDAHAVVLTDSGYRHIFDPNTDWIPGNPGWVPLSERTEAGAVESRAVESHAVEESTVEEGTVEESATIEGTAEE